VRLDLLAPPFASRQKVEKTAQEGKLRSKRLLILLIKKSIVFIRGPARQNEPKSKRKQDPFQLKPPIQKSSNQR
jgi:hypothetical protein